jgi:hypothetical protein
MSDKPTQPLSKLPNVPPPSFPVDAKPGYGQLPEPGRNRTRIIIAAIASILVVAVIAAATVLMISGQSHNDTRQIQSQAQAAQTQRQRIQAQAQSQEAQAQAKVAQANAEKAKADADKAKAEAAKPTVVVVPNGQTTTVNPSNTSSGGLYAVDSNISATTGISAGLASSVFYDYWANGGTSAGPESYSSWSPASQQYYSVNAASDGTTVTAYVSGTNDPNAKVVFSQQAINDYSQADANAFIASGNHGSGGGTQTRLNGGRASNAYGTPGTTATGIINPEPSLTYNYDAEGHLQAVNSDGTVVYSDNTSSPLPGVPDNPNP